LADYFYRWHKWLSLQFKPFYSGIMKKKVNPVKVGLLSIVPETCCGQFEGLHENLLDYQCQANERISQSGVEVSRVC